MFGFTMSPHCAAHTRLHAGAPIHVSHHILRVASFLHTTSVLSALFKEESSEPDVLHGVLKLKGISQDFKSLQNKCSVLIFYTLYILGCVYHSQLPGLPWGNSELQKQKEFGFVFCFFFSIYKMEHNGKINKHFIFCSSSREIEVVKTNDS